MNREIMRLVHKGICVGKYGESVACELSVVEIHGCDPIETYGYGRQRCDADHLVAGFEHIALFVTGAHIFDDTAKYAAAAGDRVMYLSSFFYNVKYLLFDPDFVISALGTKLSEAGFFELNHPDPYTHFGVAYFGAVVKPPGGYGYGPRRFYGTLNSKIRFHIQCL
jgi:hypothetical protein